MRVKVAAARVSTAGPAAGEGDDAKHGDQREGAAMRRRGDGGRSVVVVAVATCLAPVLHHTQCKRSAREQGGQGHVQKQEWVVHVQCCSEPERYERAKPGQV